MTAEWKLVPVIPTEVMQDAGVPVFPIEGCDPFDAAKVWEAMIACAPEPISEQEGTVTGDMARVYDVIGLHHSHPVSVLIANFENIKRFSDYLDAVEQEFLMVPGEPSDEPEDAGFEPDDECLVHKFPARSVEHYVEQFRAALELKFGCNAEHIAHVTRLQAEVLVARAKGRAEVVERILSMEAETGLDEYIGGHLIADTGDYGSHWKEEELRQAFDVDLPAASDLEERRYDGYHIIQLEQQCAGIEVECDALQSELTKARELLKILHDVPTMYAFKSAVIAQFLSNQSAPAAKACSACGQTDDGQTGEYPCPECALPTAHDAQRETVMPDYKKVPHKGQRLCTPNCGREQGQAEGWNDCIAEFDRLNPRNREGSRAKEQEKAADDLKPEFAHQSAPAAKACSACGQTDDGQTGEYPCPECALPTAHDAQRETVDENAEFETWRSAQIEFLIRMGYSDAADAFRSLGSVQWAGWQARAGLGNANRKTVMPEREPVEILEFNRVTKDVRNEGWNACLDEFRWLNS